MCRTSFSSHEEPIKLDNCAFLRHNLREVLDEKKLWHEFINRLNDFRRKSKRAAQSANSEVQPIKRSTSLPSNIHRSDLSGLHVHMSGLPLNIPSQQKVAKTIQPSGQTRSISFEVWEVESSFHELLRVQEACEVEGVMFYLDIE